MISGLWDDYSHLLPDLVHTALAADNPATAREFLQPVAGMEPGGLPPVLAAELRWLGALANAYQCTDMDTVKPDLRAAIKAWDDFGAIPLACRARRIR